MLHKENLTSTQVNKEIELQTVEYQKIKQREKNKILDDIRNQEDTSSTSVPWYLLTWNFCVNAALSIKDALQQIPAFLFPDGINPGDREILPEVAFSQWPSLILKLLGPIALFYQWKNTYNLIKRFNQAKNKNWERYKEVFVSVLSSVGWTLVTLATVVATSAFFLKVVPYIVAGMFVLNAVNGLVNCVANLYYAFTAKNSMARKEFLWNAAKSLIGIVTNTLGFVVSLFLGIRTSEAVDLIFDDFPNNVVTGLNALSDAFVSGTSYLVGITAGVVAGITMQTVNFNKETWKAITNPIQTLKECWSRFTENPLSIIPMAANLVLRTAALVFAPIQLAVYGIKTAVLAGLSYFTSKKSQAAKENQASLSPSANNKDMHLEIKSSENNRLKLLSPKMDEKSSVIQRAEDKIKKLNAQLGVYHDRLLDKNNNNFRSLPDHVKKRIAKKVLLQESVDCLKSPAINKSLESVEAKVQSSYRDVYCSFWKRKGEVEEIMDDMKQLSKVLSPSAS